MVQQIRPPTLVLLGKRGGTKTSRLEKKGLSRLCWQHRPALVRFPWTDNPARYTGRSHTIFRTRQRDCRAGSPALGLTGKRKRRTAETYVFRMDLPGVGRDKINIEIQGNRLTINGERPLEAEPKIAAYHSIERETGAFERQFTVPGHVDVDAAEASYVDGVLVLVLPKCEEDRPGNVRVECRG
ncbi:MAG: Hsp20/alpha crystallin family protein [Deltaproteobacteria bacterium]